MLCAGCKEQQWAVLVVRLQGQGGPGAPCRKIPSAPSSVPGRQEKGKKGEKGKIRVQGVPDLVGVFSQLLGVFMGLELGWGRCPSPNLSQGWSGLG